MITRLTLNFSAILWKNTDRATKFFRPRLFESANFKLQCEFNELLPEVEKVSFFEHSCVVDWEDENKRLDSDKITEAIIQVLRIAYSKQNEGYFPYLENFDDLKIEIDIPSQAEPKETPIEETIPSETKNRDADEVEAQVVHELRVNFKTDIYAGEHGEAAEPSLDEIIVNEYNLLDQLPRFDGCRFVHYSQEQLVIGFVSRLYTPTHQELAAQVLHKLKYAAYQDPQIFGYAPSACRADISQLLIFTDEHNLPVTPSALQPD